MVTDPQGMQPIATDTRNRSALAEIVSWVTAVAVPVALIGLAVRLILLPIFFQAEYHLPGFPADEYGFTTADRVHWAQYAWDYLTTPADISYLGNLKFDDGRPLYNERELSHMQDVKGVVSGTFRVWYAALAVLALAGFWAWRAGQQSAFLAGLSRGGWLTIGLAGLIGSIVLIGLLMDPDVFWNFFAWFHSLFFKGNTWIFEYSDTLIRLFPIRFWEDTFLAGAGIVLAGGLGLALGFRKR